MPATQKGEVQNEKKKKIALNLHGKMQAL